MRRPVLLLALWLLGCSSGVPGGLKYYWDSDPRSLDPALSTDVPTGEAVTLLFDNLTEYDPDGHLVPGLATAWWPSPDGRRWTFRLRSGVKFHNGQPVTTATVGASLVRALRMSHQGGRIWPLLPIVGAIAVADSGAILLRGFAQIDDSTIALTLTEPLNIFPKLMAMPVAAIVPEITDDNAFAEHPIGTGPWIFVSWSHDDMLVFARNPSYWNGPPQSDSLHVRIVPEVFTQAAEYEAGRLSVVEVPGGETGRWMTRRPQELQRRTAIRAWYIAINTRRGALADVRVRQALNHAINIPALLHQVMHDRGVLAAGSIPPGLDGYDSTRARYKYDPDLARRMLVAAGHPSLELELWRSPRAEFARIAQAVQADLQKVGVKVEILERDAASARSVARKGEADLFLSDWWADYPDGENFTFPLFHSSNAGTGGNYAFLKDPGLDSMLVRARTTNDSAEKAALLRRIDARVFDEAPWIFCWFPTDLWAMHSDVHGWSYPLIFTGQRWNTVSITP